MHTLKMHVHLVSIHEIGKSCNYIQIADVAIIHWIMGIILNVLYNFTQLRRFPMFERSVPLMAVISANTVNIPLMRKE